MKTVKNNDDCVTPDESVKYIVIEIMATINIDGYWFKRNHQYPYLRSEKRTVLPEHNIGFNTCTHHITEIDGKEYAIPEHIGVATTVLKSEIQQDIMKWIEFYYRDNTKDKTRRYLRDLPVWDTEETYSAPFYSGELQKQIMLKKAGEES